GVDDVGRDRDLGLVLERLFFLLVLLEDGAGWPEPGELGLLEIGLGAARAGEHSFDELLIERIDGHRAGYLLAVMRRVWSRRRWSDSRWSFMPWLSRTSWSTVVRSPEPSASARADCRYSDRSSSARSSRSMVSRSTSYAT